MKNVPVRAPKLMGANGVALEGLWRALGIPAQPPLTRHAVDLLCCGCTLRDDKARAELGYRPVIGVEEGLRALASANGGKERT